MSWGRSPGNCRKAVQKMDTTKVDYILDIFRTLSSEVPDQMLYRENGDSIELRNPDSIGNDLQATLRDSGWNLIGTRITEAA